jgi:hypothetical protein
MRHRDYNLVASSFNCADSLWQALSRTTARRLARAAAFGARGAVLDDRGFAFGFPAVYSGVGAW